MNNKIEKLEVENNKLKNKIKESDKNIERIFFFIAIGVGFYFYGVLGAILGLIISYISFGMKEK